MPTALDDSDDHDDFNPIEDLMPPTMSHEEIEKIGKKRARDRDPLRCLQDDEPSLSPGKDLKSLSPDDEPDYDFLQAKRRRTEQDSSVKMREPWQDS